MKSSEESLYDWNVAYELLGVRMFPYFIMKDEFLHFKMEELFLLFKTKAPTEQFDIEG